MSVMSVMHACPQGSGIRLGHNGAYFDENVDHDVEVNLTEFGWRHLEGSTSDPGTFVPREEFMIVLGRVERLLVRAAYHLHQTSVV